MHTAYARMDGYDQTRIEIAQAKRNRRCRRNLENKYQGGFK